eukprot:3160901-Prymnesium_polylepis.1
MTRWIAHGWPSDSVVEYHMPCAVRASGPQVPAARSDECTSSKSRSGLLRSGRPRRRYLLLAQLDGGRLAPLEGGRG